jgi:biotin synthase
MQVLTLDSRKPSQFQAFADRALAGDVLDRESARAVLAAGEAELQDLLEAALRVRERRWGRRVKVCMLQNARSGLCPEDCGYCSQSKLSTADIETYTLRTRAQLIEGAHAATARGARRYCMVTSGRGPSDRDIEELCAATRAIKRELPDLEICVSLGIMDAAKATRLADAGVGWVNHNLNTSERFHPEICSTHGYADRVATVRAVQSAGLRVCCGGIVGMGEDEEDVIDLGLALRELGVDSLPLNFLHPIAGTPLGDRSAVSPGRALRSLCLMRFLNPDADIRAAGGRERTLGEWQALALYPANSIFVDGYLTTPGQAVDQAREMVARLGFELEA